MNFSFIDIIFLLLMTVFFLFVLSSYLKLFLLKLVYVTDDIVKHKPFQSLKNKKIEKFFKDENNQKEILKYKEMYEYFVFDKETIYDTFSYVDDLNNYYKSLIKLDIKITLLAKDENNDNNIKIKYKNIIEGLQYYFSQNVNNINLIKEKNNLIVKALEEMDK